MNTLVPELVRLLEEEYSFHKELLANVNSEREILRRFSTEELEENNKLKETLVLKIRLMEEARQKIITQIAQCTEDSGESTLSRIAELAPAPYSVRLKELRAELISITGEVMEVNARNRNMVEYATNSINHLFSLISFAGRKNGTYTRDGRDTRKCGGAFLISRTV